MLAFGVFLAFIAVGSMMSSSDIRTRQDLGGFVLGGSLVSALWLTADGIWPFLVYVFAH